MWQDVKYDPRPGIAISALFEHLPPGCADDVVYHDCFRFPILQCCLVRRWHVIFGETAVLSVRRSNRECLACKTCWAELSPLESKSRPRLPLFAQLDVGEGELPDFFA